MHRPGEMRERQIDAPVTEGFGNAVIGVKDGATVRLNARLESLHDGILVTADVDTVPETATIGEAMAEMLGNEIRHLAVSREDRTIGLISIRDVLGALATA